MIQIEMSVIKHIQNPQFNNLLQLCQINDHPRNRIDPSPDANLQLVIMTVSVGVVAFTVEAQVVCGGKKGRI